MTLEDADRKSGSFTDRRPLGLPVHLNESCRKVLFAHSVSLSVNAVKEKWNRRSRPVKVRLTYGRIYLQ